MNGDDPGLDCRPDSGLGLLTDIEQTTHLPAPTSQFLPLARFSLGLIVGALLVWALSAGSVSV